MVMYEEAVVAGPNTQAWTKGQHFGPEIGLQ